MEAWKTKEKFVDEKSTWSPTWHAVDKITGKNDTPVMIFSVKYTTREGPKLDA